MNRVIQTRVSVPGNEKVRGQQVHAQCCFELEWRKVLNEKVRGQRAHAQGCFELESW